MSRGKSLKIKKLGMESGESNLSSLNSDFIGQTTDMPLKPPNQTVRIHNGQEGLDVVIDNTKIGSWSYRESIELSNKQPLDKKTSIKFDSQLSSMTNRDSMTYGSMDKGGEKKLEVKNKSCITICYMNISVQYLVS